MPAWCNEFGADAKKTLRGYTLSSTFVQGGRLEGLKEQENPAHVSDLSLTLGLFVLVVASREESAPRGSFSVTQPETHSSFPCGFSACSWAGSRTPAPSITLE